MQIVIFIALKLAELVGLGLACFVPYCVGACAMRLAEDEWLHADDVEPLTVKILVAYGIGLCILGLVLMLGASCYSWFSANWAWAAELAGKI